MTNYRLTVAITLQGQPVGSHDLTIPAVHEWRARVRAIECLRAEYDERHDLSVVSCREVPADEDSKKTVRP